jgi:hypothetical protein
MARCFSGPCKKVLIGPKADMQGRRSMSASPFHETQEPMGDAPNAQEPNAQQQLALAFRTQLSHFERRRL